MTKKELLKAIKSWPDDAQIELSIPTDTEKKLGEDNIWYEIIGTEEIGIVNSHCLLYAGKITME